MTTETLKHSTVEVARDFSAPPEKIFSAYADVESRADWSAPAGHEMIYHDSSFEVGGTDTYRCGPIGQADLDGHVRYLEISKDSRVVYVETMSLGSNPIAISLVTWQIDPLETGSRLTLVSQICSFVGDDMVEGTREGLNLMLDNLAAL